MENPALSSTISYGFLHHAKIWKKLMMQFKENTQTEARKDEQILFYRTLLATARGPKKKKWNKVWIKSKINKDTTKMPVMCFWCFYYQLWIYFISCSITVNVEFEQVVAHWFWEVIISDGFIFSAHGKIIALLGQRKLSDYKFASLFTQHNGERGLNPFFLTSLLLKFCFYFLCIVTSKLIKEALYTIGTVLNLILLIWERKYL